MSDLIPDPSEDGKLIGSDLKSARDQLQEKVLTGTTWCVYCLYGGCGIDALDLPCCFFVGEVCCLGGTIKLVPCYEPDGDGCCALSSKCCCTLLGIEYPIDNTPGFGCCCARYLSNIEEKTLDDCKGPAARNELDTYKKTMWCWAMYCCFQGLSYDMTPCCAQEGKVCCLYISTESASCYSDDGCIEASGKVCGTVIDCSIPAGYTPGVVCCGATICCENMPDGYEPAQEQMV